MHISMWSDSYYPYISGVTRSIATAKETLQKLGHEVSVFCPSYPGTPPEENIYRFPSIRALTNPGYYVGLPVYPNLSLKLKKLSPNVIHIHSPFNLGKLGLKMGRKMDLPVVFTYHTMYNMYSHYVPLFGTKAARVVENSAFRTARKVDAVIAPSSVIRDYLRRHGIKSKIFVIPSGVDVHQFRTGNPNYIRRRYKLPKEVPILVTCGRLGREKNLEVLLQAFSIITKKVDSFLLLVGDGPLRKSLQQLCESLGISEKTIFTGKLPPDVMPHVYAVGDIFLFTSLTDTQGLVIAEAKAAGLPAVAVGALGVKDMVQDEIDGYLCDNHPGEIAEKAIYLLKNPSRLATMKKNAWMNAMNFSKERSAEKLLQCYQFLVTAGENNF